MQSIAQPVLVGVFSPETLLSQEVKKYIAAAIATATRRAYQGDLKDFSSWGGYVPCASGTVAEYLVNRARIHSPFTIARRVVGVSKAHTSLGFPDPSKSDLVRAVLRGLRRTEGKPQRQVAAVLRQDLFPMLEQTRGTKGIRDRALLLVGFAAALRRSELVGLNVEDLKVRQRRPACAPAAQQDRPRREWAKNCNPVRSNLGLSGQGRAALDGCGDDKYGGYFS